MSLCTECSLCKLSYDDHSGHQGRGGFVCRASVCALLRGGVIDMQEFASVS